MPSFNQYEGSPSGLNYLAGDIKPWEDYVIFRSDENTSVAVYGFSEDNLVWSNCTVRTLQRVYDSGYSYYETSENNYDSVSVSITEPYYAYGNVIGVSYALPSSANISALAISSACVVLVLIKIFQSVWRLRGSFRASKF